MKRLILLVGLIMLLGTVAAKAQSQEAQQLLLDVEKLSALKNILKEMQQGYQIISKGYTSVSNVSKSNFNLHKVFIDGLLSVNPTIRNYRKIPEIINKQVLIIKEYKGALRTFKSEGLFNSDEIDYISAVYRNLFQQSLKNLNELTMVILVSTMRMDDAERLAAIARIDDNMQSMVDFLRDFNNNTSLLALQRAKDNNDINALKAIYNVNN